MSSSDIIQKQSPYDSLVTLIDSIGPMIAELLKETKKNRQDIDEMKTLLKRLTN
jgi:hypothetical protein